MKVIVEKTLQASLGIQWVTLFFNIHALLQEIPDFHSVLKGVLTLETLVQIIELIFYTWYAFQVHRIADVTRYRYYDWLVTTPLMLFTTMVYFEYQNLAKEKKKLTIEDFWNKYWKETLVVAGFNVWMLFFGYLQEIGVIGLVASTTLGFAGLFGSFYTIYDRFASKSEENLPLFWFMSSVWSLYGVAAWFPTALKNAAYNILDIFSKNFYGLFLSYKIGQLSNLKTNP
jgi:hypothetical protein